MSLTFRYCQKSPCDEECRIFESFDPSAKLEDFGIYVREHIQQGYNLPPDKIEVLPHGGTSPYPPQIRVTAQTQEGPISLNLLRIDRGPSDVKFIALVEKGHFFDY